MIGIIVALVAALGIGGTVAVADTARPGDALFGLDQKIEEVRLKIAPEAKQDELRIKFAEERVEEVDEIVHENQSGDTAERTGTASSADTSAKPILTADEEVRVKTGIESAINLLAALKAGGTYDEAKLAAITASLNDYLKDLPVTTAVQIEGNKLHVELQSDNRSDTSSIASNDSDSDSDSQQEHTKIELKNGMIEIKTKKGDDDKDSSSGKGIEEAEAKVYADRTIVKIEVGDQKATFVTTAQTKADIVAAIVAQFPALTSAQVEAALDVEIEHEPDESDDTADDSSSDSPDDTGENKTDHEGSKNNSSGGSGRED